MHKHILIATDGSELAGRAVRQGLELASKLGARVTVLTATESWSVLAMAHAADGGARHPVEAFESAAEAQARSVLDAVARQAADHGLACDAVHVSDRRPAEAIVETATARGCDLIVMASHGRRGLNHLLLGSETTKVLALTTIAVLVYR